MRPSDTETLSVTPYIVRRYFIASRNVELESGPIRTGVGLVIVGPLEKLVLDELNEFATANLSSKNGTGLNETDGGKKMKFR